MVGQAVESHAVKKSLPEKVGGKARLCRAVIKMLVDDLQRTFRVKVKGAVFVLLVAALGVGLGQKLLLVLEVLNRLTEHEPLRVVDCQTSAYRVHLRQQLVNRPFAPALQGIVQTADDFRVLSRRVFHRVAHDQELFQIFADVQAAAYCLKIVYGIRLLIGSRKCVSR